MYYVFKTNVFVALLFYGPAILAEPVINIQTRFYQVTGTDSNSIRTSMQNHGPLGKNGKRYHAYTRWDLKWNYRWIQQGHSQCSLSNVEVSIDIEYLLAELAAAEKLTPEYKSQWNDYYQALFRHEQQHKNFGVSAARELEQALLQVRSLPCSTLENHLSDIARDILQKYEQLEKDFDIRTNHGANEGIRLP